MVIRVLAASSLLNVTSTSLSMLDPSGIVNDGPEAQAARSVNQREVVRLAIRRTTWWGTRDAPHASDVEIARHVDDPVLTTGKHAPPGFLVCIRIEDIFNIRVDHPLGRHVVRVCAQSISLLSVLMGFARSQMGPTPGERARPLPGPRAPGAPTRPDGDPDRSLVGPHRAAPSVRLATGGPRSARRRRLASVASYTLARTSTPMKATSQPNASHPRNRGS